MLMAVHRMQIAMACMILGIIFFGILLGSIAEALQVWVASCFTVIPQEFHKKESYLKPNYNSSGDRDIAQFLLCSQVALCAHVSLFEL